jgi:hypothetical protein
MTDPQITEYSAIALLFLLVLIGGRIAWKWMESYNERAKAKQAREFQNTDDDRKAHLVALDVVAKQAQEERSERKVAVEAMTRLVAEDIAAKVELGAAMRALADEVHTNNGAVAAAISQMCESLKEITESHRMAEKRAAAQRREIAAKLEQS